MPQPLSPRAAPRLSGAPQPDTGPLRCPDPAGSPHSRAALPHARLAARVPAPSAAGNGISPALAAWADLAGLRRAVPRGDCSGLEFCSPLTLLHLVAGLSRRVTGLLPPGQPGRAKARQCRQWKRKSRQSMLGPRAPPPPLQARLVGEGWPTGWPPPAACQKSACSSCALCAAGRCRGGKLGSRCCWHPPAPCRSVSSTERRHSTGPSPCWACC